MDFFKTFESFSNDEEKKRYDFLNSELFDIMKDLESKYPVDLWVKYSKNSDVMILSKIAIENKKERSKGVGTIVMNTLCDFADKHNLRFALTPTNDFGGTVSRLKNFYKSFGFVNYKGYQFRESMVRYPNPNYSI